MGLFELDPPFVDLLAEIIMDVTDDELVSPESTADSERLLRQAEVALDALDEATAMWRLREALRADPTNDRAEALLHRLYAPVRPEAESEARNALREAELLARRGLLDDARAVLREALGAAPGNPRLLAELHRLGSRSGTAGGAPRP